MTPVAAIRSPKLAPQPHWKDIIRGIVREAPLPSLLVAFLVGVLVARPQVPAPAQNKCMVHRH